MVQVRVKVNSVPAKHFQMQMTSALPFVSFLPRSWVPFAGCSSWNRFRTVRRADITNSLICTEQGSKDLPLHSRLIFMIRIPWWATAYSTVKACSAVCCLMDFLRNVFKILFCHLQTITFPLKYNAGSSSNGEWRVKRAGPET